MPAPATSPDVPPVVDSDSPSAPLSEGTRSAADAPSGRGSRRAERQRRMDRQFIRDHRSVERYLSGRLPPKGALDFEQFCRTHPELLDELALGERVHAALRLLEAG